MERRAHMRSRGSAGRAAEADQGRRCAARNKVAWLRAEVSAPTRVLCIPGTSGHTHAAVTVLAMQLGQPCSCATRWHRPGQRCAPSRCQTTRARVCCPFVADGQLGQLRQMLHILANMCCTARQADSCHCKAKGQCAVTALSLDWLTAGRGEDTSLCRCWACSWTACMLAQVKHWHDLLLTKTGLH